MHLMWSYLAAALLAILGDAARANERCPPAGYTRDQLFELKARQFAIEDDRVRNALAIALLPCLADPDPQLRDGVAYEALVAWLRNERIKQPTVDAVRQALLPQLAVDYPDPTGVARPFAALALAEVARMDRIKLFMTSAQRDELLRAATSFLRTVSDYRGFDSQVGWRHGVAHGADLLMQLALHPSATKRDLDAILDALGAQIAPRGEHSYIYGEGNRLARPVFYIAQRGTHAEAEWREWLTQHVAPRPFKDWSETFQSQAGLSKRHNTAAFLGALFVYVQTSGNPKAQAALLPPLLNAMKQVP